jgi:hopene-associated glycosyltransferase HpnB
MLAISLISLFIWIGLIFFRGFFWRADQRLTAAGDLDEWPSIVAIIPARNELETIERSVHSLLTQNYLGNIKVIVVDDNSNDGTAKAAGENPNLRIIGGQPLEQGWTGKLWAVHQGVLEIDQFFPYADYVLLTDADIEHHKENLSELVYKAVTDNRHLVSLMVKLRCISIWEKLLIPTFVYFFQKLFPFPLVNSPTNDISAAAGGCMLIRLDTLRQVGGIKAIKDRLIDDCALAALIKKQGSIWLGLSERTISLRSYTDLSEIWMMVTRTAFVQLNYSILNLLLTVIGMTIIYLAPPLLFIFGLIISDPVIWVSAATSYLVMGFLYRPTLNLYEMSILHASFLPLAGLLFVLMTVSSAILHWQGKGGVWKGRSYSNSGHQG